MNKNRVIGGVVLAAIVLAAVGVWRGLGPHEGPQGSNEVNETRALAPVANPQAAREAEHGPEAGTAGAQGRIERTVRDRAVRDDVRRRIWTAWSGGTTPMPTAPPVAYDPLHSAMPELDGGAVDPAYIQERIREDFVPMAQACYDQLLTRRPGVAGELVMNFTIVGDERVGGFVDEVSLERREGGVTPDAGLFEGEFNNCLRQSMLATAFRPPPRSGKLTVRYPLTLSPDNAAGDGGAR